jgi:hypothetical protein
LALATAAYLVVTPANAGDTSSRSSERKLTEAAEGNFEVLEQADQYAEARTSPADFVDAGAFSAGYAAYKLLRSSEAAGPKPRQSRTTAMRTDTATRCGRTRAVALSTSLDA